MHRPIFLKDIILSLSKKSCFEDFSSQIYPGSHIAIIGRNGSGKASLVNILCGKLSTSGADITIPDDICIGYVEQTIHDFNNANVARDKQAKIGSKGGNSSMVIRSMSA